MVVFYAVFVGVFNEMHFNYQVTGTSCEPGTWRLHPLKEHKFDRGQGYSRELLRNNQTMFAQECPKGGRIRVAAGSFGSIFGLYLSCTAFVSAVHKLCCKAN